MMRRTLVLALGATALTTMGCSDSGSPPAPQPSATAAASAKPKKSKLLPFTAKIDGNDLVLDSALAFSRGGAALHLTVSTHPLECGKIAGAGFKLEPGEFLVDFTVAPVKLPGAEEKWLITGSRLGDVTRQGSLGAAEVSQLDPRKTVVATFADVSLAFPPTTLVIDGKLTAEGCGILPITERAKVRPQKKLEVVLNDKPVAINGASIAKDKRGRVIRLTSEPHACDKGVQGSDFGIEITLGDDGTMARAKVSGFSLPRPLFTKKGEQGLRIDLAEPDSREEQNATIAGDVTVAGSELHIDGQARVEICP